VSHFVYERHGYQSARRERDISWTCRDKQQVRVADGPSLPTSWNTA